jgi:hypothetical protein
MLKLWLVCGEMTYNDCDFPFSETVVAENAEQAHNQVDDMFANDKEVEGWSIATPIEVTVKGYTIKVEEEVDLPYELAKMMADAIDNNNHDITVDDFCDKFDIPMEDRTDFGIASIMKDANKYLDDWGY